MSVIDLEHSRQQFGTWGHRSRARSALVEAHAQGRVLDVGCSSDSYLEIAGREGDLVVGMDLLAPSSWGPAPFLAGDGERLPLRDAAFDTVLCFEALEHMADPGAAIREARRVATRLVLTVPNCEQPSEFRTAGLAFHHWVDRTHVNFFTRESLARLLESEGWKVVELTLINPIAPEVLALTTWRIPRRLSALIGKAVKLLPLRRRYYMTIAAVATHP